MRKHLFKAGWIAALIAMGSAIGGAAVAFGLLLKGRRQPLAQTNNLRIASLISNAIGAPI